MLVRYLRIDFSHPIEFSELRYFRGAAIQQAGRKHVLFHNHLNDGYRYRYPLIQYTLCRGRPSLLCLQEGIEEVYSFFKNHASHLWLNTREYRIKIERVYLNQFRFRLLENPVDYRICNWLALNDHNLERFVNADSAEDQLNLLGRILTGNILSMAKGLDWFIEGRVTVDIIQVLKTYPLPWKGTSRRGFTVRFHSNVLLPDYIGLGKGASLGYGQVKRWREKKPLKEPEQQETQIIKLN